MMKLWWNDDETYDEIAMKAVSNCLVRMTACWDPEFEPSIEEIVNHRWYNCGDSLSWLSLVSSQSGGFPYSVQHLASVHVNWLKPRTPIFVYAELAQFVNVS